jgi:site-specific DNA recombinase
VTLHTLSEGVVSQMHVGFKGTMNSMFLEELRRKTHRGLQGRALKGKSAGGKSYGYDTVRSLDASGEPITGERTVNEFEASIVKRIFSEYVRGKSPKKIAFDLNEDGVSAPTGGAWGASTIYGNRHRGTGVLNNELYIGRQVWNRQRYLKDPTTGKRVSRPNP